MSESSLFTTGPEVPIGSYVPKENLDVLNRRANETLNDDVMKNIMGFLGPYQHEHPKFGPLNEWKTKYYIFRLRLILRWFLSQWLGIPGWFMDKIWSTNFYSTIGDDISLDIRYYRYKGYSEHKVQKWNVDRVSLLNFYTGVFNRLSVPREYRRLILDGLVIEETYEAVEVYRPKKDLNIGIGDIDACVSMFNVIEASGWEWKWFGNFKIETGGPSMWDKLAYEDLEPWNFREYDKAYSKSGSFMRDLLDSL